MGLENQKRERELKKVGCDGGGEAVEDYFYILPEDCTANIVSLTSPRDACRLCLVSSIFRSAAESDAVWERFIPSECLSILSSRSCPSKKDLYFSLCDQPLLIDEGRKVIYYRQWTAFAWLIELD